MTTFSALHRLPFLILGFVFALSFVATQNVSGQWVQTNGPMNGRVSALGASDSILVAGENDAMIIRSTDSGATWRLCNVNLGTDQVGGPLFAFARIGSTFFAATDLGLIRSDIQAIGWQYTTSTGLGQVPILSLVASADTLYAGTRTGVYLSKDSGSTWSILDTGLVNVNNLVIRGDKIVAGTDSGILLSTNAGTNWISSDSGLTNDHVLCLLSVGSNLIAGTEGGGIFRSTDGGIRWSAANIGYSQSNTYALDWNGTNIFAASDSGFIFRSTDSGKSWNSLPTNLSFSVLSLAEVGSRLYAGTDGEGARLSVDNGGNWVVLQLLAATETFGLTVVGKTLFAAAGESIYRSTDQGGIWKVGTGFGYRLGNKVMSLWGNSTLLFAGTNITNAGELFSSTDNGKSWSPIGSFVGDVSETEAYATMGTIVFAASGGVFRSTDSGRSWSRVSNGLTNPDVWSFAVLGTYLYAGTYDGGVFRSMDSGASWEAVNAGLGFNNNPIHALAVFGTTLYAGTFGGVYRSIDSGATWQAPNTFFPNNYVYAFAQNGATIFAGTTANTADSAGVYSSGDGGLTWTRVSQGLSIDGFSVSVESFAIVDSALFAGTEGGVWRRPLSEMIPTSAVNEAPTSVQVPAQAYPNPFSSKTTIQFTASESGFARVWVVNLLGQPIAQLFEGELGAGEHSFAWDAANVPTGTYFCLIQTPASGGQERGRQVVSVRHE